MFWERYINATNSQECNLGHYYTARSAIFDTTSSSVTASFPSPSELTSPSPSSTFSFWAAVFSGSGVSSPSASPLSSSLICLAWMNVESKKNNVYSQTHLILKDILPGLKEGRLECFSIVYCSKSYGQSLQFENR